MTSCPRSADSALCAQLASLCWRLNLGATCTSLQQASRAWFPEVTVKVKPGKTDVASLAAWLDRHQAALNLVSDHQYPAATQEWDGSTILAFPTHLATPRALTALAQLTSLDLSGSVGTAPLPHLQHLCPF
ncbi:hypothetical protein D9Q98_006089 [Chlorella vulgaris]|uniref:Uncharacterized protein n=1 Tax=Chlorella vulgaris TaxID=3077 RepID=A0A9D4TWW9_CHLVU|nr:hypothetical protein D9Q98_006089 [Chlorella vulgaris]